MDLEMKKQWRDKIDDSELRIEEKNKKLNIKVGQFIGALAVHMAMAGGTVDLEALVEEPLGNILESCFENGIGFEIRNDHLSKPTFSPVFGS